MFHFPLKIEFLLLFLLSSFHVGHFEDLLLAHGGRLTYSSLCSSRHLAFNSSTLGTVSAMALHGSRVLLSDTTPEGIARLWSLELEDGAGPQMLAITGAPPGRLESLVVSADRAVLYATDSTNGAVVHVPLQTEGAAAAVSVVHLLAGDRPRGLALDERNGLLFWTNWRFGRQSLESSRLDGSGRHRLVDDDLYLPGGVAVDAASATLYFSDGAADGRLRLERAGEDGSGRRPLYEGSHPRAAGLQLAGGRLYWADTAGVWWLPLGGGGGGQARLAAPLSAEPDALLVLREDEQCTSYAPVVPTVPGPPAGSCQGYCVTGRCRLDEVRGRTCRCPAGFSGRRCETSVCHNFCLEEGACRVDAAGRPACQCPASASGDRCQHPAAAAAAEPLSSSSSGGSQEGVFGLSAGSLAALVAVLLALVALQAAVMAVLGARLRSALRRAARPPRQPLRFVAAGAKIRRRPPPERKDIEDCCQMTLCETPCAVSTSACERRSLVDSQEKAGCDNSQALADLF